MAALHHEGSRPQRRPRLRVPSRSSRAAASVKNTEPAKKTTPSAPAPTSWTKPGKGPMKKQADPAANPTAIRSQAAAWPAAGRRPARDRSSRPLEQRAGLGRSTRYHTGAVPPPRDQWIPNPPVPPSLLFSTPSSCGDFHSPPSPTSLSPPLPLPSSSYSPLISNCCEHLSPIFSLIL